MFYRSVIPLVLFFMWNSKRPSSFTVNKSRGEIKYVSSPWFLLCYHWSSMQLIFESVWKPCTQAMHFFHPEANILEIYHWAKTQIISSHGYCSGGVCVCIYKNIYFHTVPQRHRQRSTDTHIWYEQSSGLFHAAGCREQWKQQYAPLLMLFNMFVSNKAYLNIHTSVC